MPKPRSDDPREYPVTTRFTQSELAQLDEVRGVKSRSEFIRDKVLRRGRP